MTHRSRCLLSVFALVFLVPGPALAQWVTPPVTAPRVEYRTFRSDAAGAAVSYHVYTPPAYDSNPTRRFPVLYWLHGAGNPTGGIAGVSGWFDVAIAAGLIPPMLVVFPNGMPYGMWCNSKDGAVPMESVVVGELIPEIDANFRTIVARSGRIIEGFSMGGYGAARLGFRHHHLFAGVSLLGAGPMQSDFMDEPPGTNFPLQLRMQIYENVWGSDPAYYLAEHPLTIVRQNAASIIEGGQVVRQAVGQLDAMLGPNATFHALLADLGVPHEYTTPEGVGHHSLQLMKALGVANWEFYRTVFGPPCPGWIRIINPSAGDNVFGLIKIHAEASDDHWIETVDFFIGDVKLNENLGSSLLVRGNDHQNRFSERRPGGVSRESLSSAPTSVSGVETLSIFIDNGRLRILDRQGLPGEVLDGDHDVSFIQPLSEGSFVVLFRTFQVYTEGFGPTPLVCIDLHNGTLSAIHMGPGVLHKDSRFSPAFQKDGKDRLYAVINNNAMASLRRLSPDKPAQEIFREWSDIEEWLVCKNGTVILSGKHQISGERWLKSLSPEGVARDLAFRNVKTEWLVETVDGTILAGLSSKDIDPAVYNGVYKIPVNSGYLGEYEARRPLIGRADGRFIPQSEIMGETQSPGTPEINWIAVVAGYGSALFAAIRNQEGPDLVYQLYPSTRPILFHGIERVDLLKIHKGLLYLAGTSEIGNCIVVHDPSSGFSSTIPLGEIRIDDLVVLDDGFIVLHGRAHGLNLYRIGKAPLSSNRGSEYFGSRQDRSSDPEGVRSFGRRTGPEPSKKDFFADWNTLAWPNGRVSIKAVATDSSGRTASDEIFVNVTNMALALNVTREEVRAWAVVRHMGALNVAVENPGMIQVSRFVILRKAGNSEFQTIAEIPSTGATQSGFAFQDKWLNHATPYTYRIEALNAKGTIIGRSADKTI